ncbi:hypothetical protein DRP04_12860 [Archaeoglobales archaeon]|nr:MAG: hypothetical protein DRP04_12860 [Archaeoglobales archaeon]
MESKFPPLGELQLEPDFGKQLIGYHSRIKLMAQHLTNALTKPITANYVLRYPEPCPADVLGNDYLEKTVEAAAGTTASNSVSATFTFLNVNTLRFAGLAEIVASVYLELRQVDGTYPGTARITTITVDLLKYDVESGQAASLGSASKTVNRSISGTASANTTFSELFEIEIPKSSPLVIDENTLLQLKVTVEFEAVTDASASTTTIAAARINFARGSDETYVRLPLV